MTERVIRINRELLQSLPLLYQTIAKIGEKSDRVIIVDENNRSKLEEFKS